MISKNGSVQKRNESYTKFLQAEATSTALRFSKQTRYYYYYYLLHYWRCSHCYLLCLRPLALHFLHDCSRHRHYSWSLPVAYGGWLFEIPIISIAAAVSLLLNVCLCFCPLFLSALFCMASSFHLVIIASPLLLYQRCHLPVSYQLRAS